MILHITCAWNNLLRCLVNKNLYNYNIFPNRNIKKYPVVGLKRSVGLVPLHVRKLISNIRLQEPLHGFQRTGAQFKSFWGFSTFFKKILWLIDGNFWRNWVSWYLISSLEGSQAPVWKFLRVPRQPWHPYCLTLKGLAKFLEVRKICVSRHLSTDVNL